MRLDKFVSHTLNKSRRDARLLIRKGHIIVNGIVVVEKDFFVDNLKDVVSYRDKRLKYYDDIYIMLNKPIDYVSATRDSRKPTVLDLVHEYKKYNLFIVGRLDIDTVGFILLTNDGVFAYNIMKPSNLVPKEYELEIEEEFNLDDVERCKQGFIIKDGRGKMIKTMPARLSIINKHQANLVIYEGKYHQIKQMCQQMGKNLIRLKRIRIGEVSLDSSLQEGEFRHLSDDELNILKRYSRN